MIVHDAAQIDGQLIIAMQYVPGSTLRDELQAQGALPFDRAVTMQDNVTVLTARKFGATFYRRLLEHGTVDLAMNEARSTLITNGRYDAAVPVLFMRLRDGRLLNVTANAASGARQH